MDNTNSPEAADFVRYSPTIKTFAPHIDEYMKRSSSTGRTRSRPPPLLKGRARGPWCPREDAWLRTGRGHDLRDVPAAYVRRELNHQTAGEPASADDVLPLSSVAL